MDQIPLRTVFYILRKGNYDDYQTSIFALDLNMFSVKEMEARQFFNHIWRYSIFGDIMREEL